MSRASVRTAAELHDRVLAAAEQTLDKYMLALAQPEPPDSIVLPSALAKLAELAIKLQAGADKEPSPQASDLDKRRAEAAKLRKALDASKVSAAVSADEADA